MGGGGGGSTDIAERIPSQEKKTIGNWYDFQNNQLFDYINKSPILSAANTGALDFWKQLPGMLEPLQNLYQNLPSVDPTIERLRTQFGGIPTQLMNMSQGLQGRFGGLPQQLQQQFGQIPNQLLGMSSQLGNQFGGLPQQLMNLTKPLTGTANNYLSGILRSQGALSPEASRDISQQTRQLASQYGTGRQLGTLGTELLNRQGAREARYATGLNQYNQATGQIGALNQLAQGLGTNLAQTRAGLQTGAGQFGIGLAQARQGLGTNLAQTRQGLLQGAQGLGTGLEGFLQNMRGVDISQRTGLAGAMQNLQSGGLNQLLGVQQGNTSTFTQLQNPMLSYLSNLFGGNLQARMQEAGINAQANQASDNKTGGLVSGGISAVASILPLLMMSDERMKTKIRKTKAITPEGIPLKTWEYKTRPGVRFLSPMAQDVEKKLPDRVLADPVSGVKFIVGFPVVEVSPMKRKAA